MTTHPAHRLIYLVESDHRVLGKDEADVTIANLVSARESVSAQSVLTTAIGAERGGG